MASVATFRIAPRREILRVALSSDVSTGSSDDSFEALTVTERAGARRGTERNEARRAETRDDDVAETEDVAPRPVPVGETQALPMMRNVDVISRRCDAHARGSLERLRRCAMSCDERER
jgi:hypothetical protein